MTGVVIYSLHEPHGELRYIGKTKNPLTARLKGHLNEARSGRQNYRCKWIRKLLASNTHPTIRLIGSAVGDGVDDEIYWIAFHKAQGARLVNATIGGEGVTNPPAEVRMKIGLAHLGKKPSKAHRKNLSTAQKERFKRSSAIIFDGERITANDLAKRIGISDSTLNSRLKAGESLAEATSPVRRKAGRKPGGTPSNKLPNQIPSLVGFTCGKLTIVSADVRRNKYAFMLAECTCGKKSWKQHSSLIAGTAGCRACSRINHPLPDGIRQRELESVV